MGLLTLSVLVSLAVLFVVYWVDKERLEKEVVRRTELIPHIMALSNAKQIAENDIAALQDAVLNIMDLAPEAEMIYLYILDGEGEVLVGEMGGRLSPPEIEELENFFYHRRSAREQKKPGEIELTGEKIKEMEREARKEKQTQTQMIPLQLTRTEKTLSTGLQILDVIVPITLDQASIVWGAIRVGFSVNSFYDFLKIGNVLIVFGVILVCSTLMGGIIVTRSLTDGTVSLIEDISHSIERHYRDQIQKSKKEEVETAEGQQPLTGQEFFNILDVAKRIGATLNLNEVLNMAVGSIVRVMRVRVMTLFLLDSATNELVGKIGYDENGIIGEDELSTIRFQVGQGDVGLTAEFGTTTIIDEPQPGSALAAALVSRGQVIGVFLVRNKINEKPFNQKDKLVARLLSTLIANAIYNATEYERLKTQSFQ